MNQPPPESPGDTAQGLKALRDRRRAGRAEPASLKSELLHNAYATARRAILANLLAIASFVLVGLTQVSHALLFGWAAVTAMWLLGRLVLLRSRMRSEAFPEPAARLTAEFVIGATTSGAMFGVGFLLLAPQLDFARQLLLTLTMSGMSAGATLSMAASRGAYVGYTATSLGVAFVWFIIAAGNSPTFAALATLFVTGAYTLVMTVLHAGARRFVHEAITLQIDNDRFVAALERYSANLSRDREEYRAASLTDALTGVANRRSFDEALQKFWHQAARNSERIGCLLIDVDHFKSYNDTLGHTDGDACLRRLADAMHGVAKRGGDFLARYGGEEFVLLAPNTTSAGTLYLAEAIREAVESLEIAHPSSPGNVVTVSVGATSMAPAPGTSASELVAAADSALYEAKAGGRNRIQLSRESGTMTVGSGSLAVATAGH